MRHSRVGVGACFHFQVFFYFKKTVISLLSSISVTLEYDVKVREPLIVSPLRLTTSVQICFFFLEGEISGPSSTMISICMPFQSLKNDGCQFDRNRCPVLVFVAGL